MSTLPPWLSSQGFPRDAVPAQTWRARFIPAGTGGGATETDGLGTSKSCCDQSGSCRTAAPARIFLAGSGCHGTTDALFVVGERDPNSWRCRA